MNPTPETLSNTPPTSAHHSLRQGRISSNAYVGDGQPVSPAGSQLGWFKRWESERAAFRGLFNYHIMVSCPHVATVVVPRIYLKMIHYW